MNDDMQELLSTVRTLAENYAEVPSPIVLELLDLIETQEDHGLPASSAVVSESEPPGKDCS